jgi:NADH-quinone oxidoreductase subunit D
MIKGALLSDAIVILSSLNVIAGELDACKFNWNLN